jgi:hypothetical protein
MELGNIPIAISQVIATIPPMDMVLIISYSVCEHFTTTLNLLMMIVSEIMSF